MYDTVLETMEEDMTSTKSKSVSLEAKSQAWIESIPDNNISNLGDNIDKEMLKEQLAKVSRTLAPREVAVIDLRFGMSNGYSRTLKEIASLFSVSQERIRQIECKALRKLRHPSRIEQLYGCLELI